GGDKQGRNGRSSTSRTLDQCHTRRSNAKTVIEGGQNVQSESRSPDNSTGRCARDRYRNAGYYRGSSSCSQGEGRGRRWASWSNWVRSKHGSGYTCWQTGYRESNSLSASACSY